MGLLVQKQFDQLFCSSNIDTMVKNHQRKRRRERRELSDLGAAGKTSAGGLSIGAFIRAKQQDPSIRRQRKRDSFISNAKIVYVSLFYPPRLNLIHLLPIV